MQEPKQPRKYLPPLSLHPLSFDQAVGKIVAAKPVKPAPAPTPKKKLRPKKPG